MRNNVGKGKATGAGKSGSKEKFRQYFYTDRKYSNICSYGASVYHTPNNQLIHLRHG